MSITVFKGLGWGVEKHLLTDGAGSTSPHVVSATAFDPNTVRVVFDRSMNFGFNPRSTGLRTASYQVQRISDLEDLGVLGVTYINDATVELLTNDQDAISYRVTVLSAEDVWDNVIDPAFDTADFTGDAPVYPSIEDVGSFIGMYSGMQHELNSGVLPDPDAPYLADQNPMPGQSGLSPLSPVVLSVRDLVPGLDVSSVYIKVEGNDAWKNETQQTGYSVVTAIVPDGVKYTITPTISLTPLSTILVEVYAEDLSPIPNVLLTSYSFETRGDDAPVISIEAPVANATNVDTTVYVSFNITDNIAVDPATVVVLIYGELAYQLETELNGFTVVRTPIAQGYNYKITHTLEWPYNRWIDVNVYAKDVVNTVGSKTWQFLTELDSRCFTGPLNETEVALLHPFVSLNYCERLRQSLLTSVTTNSAPDEGSRSIFLRAHSQEFAPVMFDIVPVPTLAEKSVRLCNKATNLSISNYLRRKTNLLPGAIHELMALGLPYEHRALFEAYAREDQPNTEVPLACVIVLLAKAFE